MEKSEMISIPKYASMNRMSIHTVIKKTMSGELPTLVKEENGKEVTYILTSPTEQKNTIPTHNESDRDDEIEIDYQKEYEALHKEYLILKTKYEKLLQAQSNS